ncbi:MAG: hypothetical protein ABIR17_10005 [Pseudolysinimonas sp.]|uniref:hypothetical protein n=1 Tax=Pseudolysinimonas sp. TaxID=2680009 RepID=UPI0032657360
MNVRISRIATLVVGATLLLSAPLALSGCSLVQGVVQQQTGGTGGTDGTVLGSVPADFPSDLPLVDGKVTFGAEIPTGSGQKAWTVIVQTPGSENPGTAIQAQIEAAGWTTAAEGIGGVTDQGAVFSYTKGNLGAAILVGKDGDTWTVSYTVTTITP